MIGDVFTDSNWIGKKDDRTSTPAFIIYLGKTLISWTSKKQKTVARSSIEAEFRAIALMVSELFWIQSLMKELQCNSSYLSLVLCDNLSATYTCVNMVFHTRMKHLALDYFFIIEKVGNKELEVRYIPSTSLANLLTKALPKNQFESLISKISVGNSPPNLHRGGIKDNVKAATHHNPTQNSTRSSPSLLSLPSLAFNSNTSNGVGSSHACSAHAQL